MDTMPPAEHDLTVVLFVDDDQAVTEVFAEMLRSLGCHVTTAVNGTDAWRELQAGQYDVLITDLLMPDGGGRELLIRSQTLPADRRPYVIVSSAFGGSELQQEASTEGARCYLVKPIEFDALERAMQAARAAREGTGG